MNTETIMKHVYKDTYGISQCKGLPEKTRQRILDRIRKRKSYKFFGELLQLIRSGRDPIKILHEIHGILDHARSFGSETRSAYAKESINLLELDAKRVTQMPKGFKLITSLEELEAESEDTSEFIVRLNGGIASRKIITWDKEKKKFWVVNCIDDSEQILSREDMMDRRLTIIGDAIRKNAFFKDER